MPDCDFSRAEISLKNFFVRPARAVNPVGW